MTFDGSSVNRRQGSDTKTEILDIALSLFVKKGYHETSMQDIADTAGLTKGGLYYYIKSKDDVLFLLHDRFIVEGLRRLRLVEAEALEPEHKLIELLKMHLQIIDQFKDDITLFFNCMKYLSDDKKQAVQVKRDEYEDIFVRVLEEGKKKKASLKSRTAISSCCMFWEPATLCIPGISQAKESRSRSCRISLLLSSPKAYFSKTEKGTVT